MSGPEEARLAAAARLLKILSDGTPHPQTSVRDAVAVNATVLTEAIGLLGVYGLQVDATDSDYRLCSRVELLDESVVRAALPSSDSAAIGLDIELLVDSTNARLLDERGGTGAWVCLAEAQTSGRGRRGRRWVSPMARNLYLSLRWEVAAGVRPGGIVTLALGAAVARAIALSTGLEVGLKWPNDLLWEGRKLGGLLVEQQAVDCGAVLIIGVGVNVSMPRRCGTDIDQPWVTLAEACAGSTVSRNVLAAAIIGAIIQTMRELDSGDTAAWLSRWQRLDFLRGRPVRLYTADGASVVGVAGGVAANGALLIECDGEVRSYYAGEVSLRLLV